MKLSHDLMFNLEYFVSWFVVRVLRLNITWCVETYKDYQVLVHGTKSAERKRDRMSDVLYQMAKEAAERKRQRSR